jgi:hypothetical protein
MEREESSPRNNNAQKWIWLRVTLGTIAAENESIASKREVKAE